MVTTNAPVNPQQNAVNANNNNNNNTAPQNTGTANNNTTTQNTGTANNTATTQNTGNQAVSNGKRNGNANNNSFNFGGNTNGTGTDSFNQSELNSFVAGDPKGSLALSSQPIESMFGFLNGIDGNNINSNQNLFSAVTNLLSLFLNPKGASEVNAAEQNGTLQQLINQTLNGQGTNTTQNGTTTTGGNNAANGNGSTGATGAKGQNGQQGQTGTAQTQNAQQAAAAQAPQVSSYGANGQFQLSASFLKQQALALRKGTETQAQVQAACQQQVQTAADALAGGNVGSDFNTDHTFVADTCAFANPQQGIDYQNSDTGWVNGCAQTKVSGDTSCAVAEVDAAAGCNTTGQVCANAPSAQQIFAAAPSALAAQATPAAAAPLAAEQQAVTQNVQQGHASDPLVFNTSGGGIQTSNQQKVVADIDGKNETVNNITANESVATININGKNQILGDKTDLSSLGISQKPTSAQDAFNLIAQKAYSEHLISSPTNLNSHDLQVLHEKFGLSVNAGSLNGPSESFAQAGIKSMNLSNGPTQTQNNFDGNGNTLVQNGTTVNGNQNSVGDVWYQVPN